MSDKVYQFTPKTLSMPADEFADAELSEEEDLAAKYSDCPLLTFSIPLQVRWAYQRALVVDYRKSDVLGVSDRLLDLIVLGERTLEEWPAVCLEVFAMLWARPRDLALLQHCSPLGLHIVQFLESSDEWSELRDACCGRRAVSLQIAKAVLRGLYYEVLRLQDLPKNPTAAKAPPFLPGEGAEGEENEEAKSLRESLQRKLKRGTDPLAVVFAWLATILQQAKSLGEVDQLLRNALSGLSVGPGYSAGGGSDPVEDAIDMELVELLRKLPMLRDLLQLVGSIQASAKTADEGALRTTPVGVVQGTSLPDLVTSEHALRTVSPDAWAHRYVERETLQVHKVSEEAAEQGDLIVVKDDSGSMEGEAWRWASGLAGALLLEALKEGRRCVVARYSDIRHYRDAEVLRPDHLTEGLKTLSMLPGGGTDTAAALQKASKRLKAPLRRPDIVLITDGGWPALDDITTKMLKGPDGKGRLFVVLLEPSGDAVKIPQAAEVWVIPQLDMKVATQVLRAVRQP